MLARRFVTVAVVVVGFCFQTFLVSLSFISLLVGSLYVSQLSYRLIPFAVRCDWDYRLASLQ